MARLVSTDWRELADRVTVAANALFEAGEVPEEEASMAMATVRSAETTLWRFRRSVEDIYLRQQTNLIGALAESVHMAHNTWPDALQTMVKAGALELRINPKKLREWATARGIELEGDEWPNTAK